MTHKLLLGDCLDEMHKIPTASVDVVLTDPPFFTPATHYQSRVSWGRCWSDLSVLGQFFYDVVVEAKRVLNPHGHLFVFCHDESYPVFYPVAFGLWDNVYGLVWDKKHVGLGRTFRHQFELILWAHNQNSKVVEDGKCHSNILKYNAPPSQERHHPTEKPVALLAELLSMTSMKDDVVLDPFMGSGSTGVACVELGRCFKGIELNPEYYEIAKRRLEAASAQQRL